jgi:hypothetical protein
MRRLADPKSAKKLLHICDGPDQIGIAIHACHEHERRQWVIADARSSPPLAGSLQRYTASV